MTKLTDQEREDRNNLLVARYRQGDYITSAHFARAVGISNNLANKIKHLSDVRQSKQQVVKLPKQDPLDYILDGTKILINAIENDVPHEELKAIASKIKLKLNSI